MKKHLSIFAFVFLASIFIFSAPLAIAFHEEPTLAAAAQSASASTDKKDTIDENDINRFTNAIAEIKDYYVKPIDDKKLLEDAIRGMVAGLDPHSEYLDADSYKTLLMTTSGEFGGLGIEVTGEFGVLKVISPIDDTPAAKAGIKPGDYIVAINTKLVNEMTLREAVDLMRGAKGSQVTLTILRKGNKEPINFKLTRDIIHIASVKGSMPSPGYGYIKISQFQQPTTELMIDAIDKLKKQNGGNLKGLVLDLRNDPGGLLETAVQVTDVFLDSKKLGKFKKVIVYTEGRLPNAQYTAKASGGDILNGAPIVVLINEGSASASEIVAGALQDYKRAIILGTTSFGKGSVQTVLPLDNNHAIKLTTALYHTPSGRLIQNQGIIPDITIDNFKVSSLKPDDGMIEPIREFDLKGHLKNKTLKNDNLTSDNNDIVNVAVSDFQLYEALKILRTVNMVDQNNATDISQPAIAEAPAANQTAAAKSP